MLHELIGAIKKAESDEQLDLLLDETSSTGQVNSAIINASSWDMTEVINIRKCDALISELIVDELLRKRLPQMNAIADGLVLTGVLQYIRSHPSLMGELFVTGNDISTLAILASITKQEHNLSDDEERVYSWLISFIENASKECLSQLLQFATSLKSFPPIGLKPKIEIGFHSTCNKVYPEAAVCFRQMNLPVCHNEYSDFERHMNTALSLGTEGFGLM
eukprot:Seg199.14 transcript_id=Seg199.14/GoldUCD/mRNA.D3Y31 product="Apoptosis-resistant E3 ubiquitin protein ligase 1" protein_id=Seg199.14/GoldUCD/D3Y31